jgi:HEPN domain-containing protein
MVLSSELYLKCLICIETGKSPPKGHDLKALFLRLDLPTRKYIEDLWDEDLKRQIGEES